MFDYVLLVSGQEWSHQSSQLFKKVSVNVEGESLTDTLATLATGHCPVHEETALPICHYVSCAEYSFTSRVLGVQCAANSVHYTVCSVHCT